MKILIVNFSDLEGGAARAAYRLHKSLLQEGIDSQMLVQKKESDDFTILGPQTTYEILSAKVNGILNPFPLRFYKSKGGFSTSFVSSAHIVKKINKLNPDIVHLHWIHAGMLKIEDFRKIKAPIVWSLHDMWAFTGGCHYDQECGAYVNECGNCPALNSKKENDISRRIFRRKQEVFSKIDNMTIVGLSTWLARCAKESTLLKDKTIVNLPNPINTTIFKPHDQKTSRTLWNLPYDKKLVLFGSMTATSDARKGFSKLSQALEQLSEQNIELIVFGSSSPEKPQDLGYKVHYLGSLSDDVSLVTLYNAVDVMIVPSLQENLSNAIMESMACGTPVVAFDIGGNGDMIDHKVNGYLTQAFDTVDMAKGIEWVLDSRNARDLSIEAREKVLSHFESNVVAKKYIDLYQNILHSVKKQTKVSK